MGKRVSLGRHKRACSVCAHPKCSEIEGDLGIPVKVNAYSGGKPNGVPVGS
jgi:hypothetical protein